MTILKLIFAAALSLPVAAGAAGLVLTPAGAVAQQSQTQEGQEQQQALRRAADLERFGREAFERGYVIGRLHKDQPQLVLDSIREVVEAVRAGKTSLEP